MAHSFADDKEKISDMLILSKDEFLQSYSYLTAAEYDATVEDILRLIEGGR